MSRIAGTVKEISDENDKIWRANKPQGFTAPARLHEVSAFTAFVLAVSAELNEDGKVRVAKVRALATKVAAAKEAALEARLKKEGRTMIKCTFDDAEGPSTYWAGVEIQTDNNKGYTRCLCTACSREQMDGEVTLAAEAVQGGPATSSPTFPSSRTIPR